MERQHGCSWYVASADTDPTSFLTSAPLSAGSDNRVRLWSLETGKQLTAENSSDGLAAEDFQEPVKALSFQHGAPSPILHIASGPCICTYRV